MAGRSALKSDEKIVVSYSQRESLTAPVEEGTQVGEVEYRVDDVVYKRQIIVTSNAVKEIDLKWCLEEIFQRFSVFE